MFNVLKTLGILPSPERFQSHIVQSVVGLFQKSPAERMAEAQADLDERRKGAFDTEEAARLAASQLEHENKEGSRINRGGILGDALGAFSGDFALSPEQIEAIKNKRHFTDYKREFNPSAVDPSLVKQGFGSKLASLAGGIGDAFLTGLGGIPFPKIGGGQDASQPTSLRDRELPN